MNKEIKLNLNKLFGMSLAVKLIMTPLNIIRLYLMIKTNRNLSILFWKFDCLDGIHGVKAAKQE